MSIYSLRCDGCDKDMAPSQKSEWTLRYDVYPDRNVELPIVGEVCINITDMMDEVVKIMARCTLILCRECKAQVLAPIRARRERAG